MNTRLASSLALFALCSALNLAAADTVIGELPIASVPARIEANGDTVTPGATRIAVALRLGRPALVLPDGSWVYRGYTGRFGNAGAADGNLIVRFHDNKVSTLTLADHFTVVALGRQPAASPNLVAATASRR